MASDTLFPMEIDKSEIRREKPTRARFVCSLAQRRFWVLERLDPGNPALNVAVRWALDGPISMRDIEAAWRRIVDRHDVLRTFFVAENGEPVQVVESALDFRLSVVDLMELPEAEATERA